MAGPKIVHFDRVEWLVNPDPGTAIAALQAGEVDWVEQPLLDLLPVLRKNPDIRPRSWTCSATSASSE